MTNDYSKWSAGCDSGSEFYTRSEDLGGNVAREDKSICVLSLPSLSIMALRLSGKQFREIMGPKVDQHELLGGRGTQVSCSSGWRSFFRRA